MTSVEDRKSTECPCGSPGRYVGCMSVGGNVMRVAFQCSSKDGCVTIWGFNCLKDEVEKYRGVLV